MNFSFQILYFAIAESSFGLFFKIICISLWYSLVRHHSITFLCFNSFDMFSFSSLSIFTRVDVKSLSHKLSVWASSWTVAVEMTVFLDDRIYCPVSLHSSYFVVLVVEVISWKLWKSDSQPFQGLLFLPFVCLMSFLILYSLCSCWRPWLS